jgi:DNA-binding MarR family transcriptional regulator
MVATVDDEASVSQPERELLAETLTQWNRLFWWAGVRPMMQRMVEADLTLAESVVLRSLRRGPLTVAQAGACLMLSHSAASRAVDRLVRDGYLAREENPDDRRQKLLTLAPRGEELLGEMEGIMVGRLAEMIDVLDVEESAQFRSLLTRILARSTADLSRTDNSLACQEGPFALAVTPETDNPDDPITRR